MVPFRPRGAFFPNEGEKAMQEWQAGIHYQKVKPPLKYKNQPSHYKSYLTYQVEGRAPGPKGSYDEMGVTVLQVRRPLKEFSWPQLYGASY